jgi:hypothetical protein
VLPPDGECVWVVPPDYTAEDLEHLAQQEGAAQGNRERLSLTVALSLSGIAIIIITGIWWLSRLHRDHVRPLDPSGHRV